MPPEFGDCVERASAFAYHGALPTAVARRGYARMPLDRLFKVSLVHKMRISVGEKKRVVGVWNWYNYDDVMIHCEELSKQLEIDNSTNTRWHPFVCGKP